MGVVTAAGLIIMLSGIFIGMVGLWFSPHQDERNAVLVALIMVALVAGGLFTMTLGAT